MGCNHYLIGIVKIQHFVQLKEGVFYVNNQS
jgi:hypothetical protein